MSNATVTSRRTRWAGTACLWAGLIGFVQAIAVIAAPASVSDDRYSYPFTKAGYTLAQLSFFVQHLPLIAGLAMLLGLPAVRASRAARTGVGAGVVGMVLLALMELVAISAAGESTVSSRAQLVDGLYGVPTMVIGVGMLIGGIALLRAGRASSDPPRSVPILVTLIGGWVFVPLLPAIMGPNVAGRLAIGGWMLLFAALGSRLAAERTVPARRDALASPLQPA